MINVIQTLKNLNKEFPRYQLETLLKIIECIQDDPIIKYPDYPDIKTTPWWNNQVTCTPFVYNTVTKNHTADKTSSNQVITSEGEEASNEDFTYSVKDVDDIASILSSTYAVNKIFSNNAEN